MGEIEVGRGNGNRSGVGAGGQSVRIGIHTNGAGRPWVEHREVFAEAQPFSGGSLDAGRDLEARNRFGGVRYIDKAGCAGKSAPEVDFCGRDNKGRYACRHKNFARTAIRCDSHGGLVVPAGKASPINRQCYRIYGGANDARIAGAGCAQPRGIIGNAQHPVQAFGARVTDSHVHGGGRGAKGQGSWSYRKLGRSGLGDTHTDGLITRVGCDRNRGVA